jgi:hypothetical protein
MEKNLFLTLTILAVAATACNKSKTVETPDGKVKVTESGGGNQIEVQTKEGKATIAASDSRVSIPDTFPKDVPLLDGAVPKLSMTQGNAQLLHLAIPRGVEAVAKEFSDKLKDQGWTIESTMNMGDTSIVSAKKDDRSCNVAVMKGDNGGSLAQLTVTAKQ